jgi:exonuclease III
MLDSTPSTFNVKRIIEITIATKVNICIINAYLPTHGTNSSEEYRKSLDVIHNIIQKYLESHVIFLCGDLSGALLQSRMNKHDRRLRG